MKTFALVVTGIVIGAIIADIVAAGGPEKYGSQLKRAWDYGTMRGIRWANVILDKVDPLSAYQPGAVGECVCPSCEEYRNQVNRGPAA